MRPRKAVWDERTNDCRAPACGEITAPSTGRFPTHARYAGGNRLKIIGPSCLAAPATLRFSPRCAALHPCGCVNVTCCSVCDGCAACSLPKPAIGVGKLDAISWMKRMMGGPESGFIGARSGGGAADATGGAFDGSGMSAMGVFPRTLIEIAYADNPKLTRAGPIILISVTPRILSWRRARPDQQARAAASPPDQTPRAPSVRWRVASVVTVRSGSRSDDCPGGD